ncbi:glycine cleavage system T protein [Beutenbergia cavernae DSM 12333]|uniref:Aminomethyltransferase n=1 Tax=Beutenbergia cavernae (strain ATCC BAA-8 / DSM 12333 / CCUG 43141 / JCM 11478 / NBRC 16432 / NCIMB 13614 / HKI 0122) TaxID=471853 RepID=C5C5H9_BEUC1|nr:glycine cleavage system aminomethyltransferase GcvT [Beutenbergia cavernae]ACQ80170.1 glycine cleavage system T protein [Beutenbergia cavernae DSM 12333]
MTEPAAVPAPPVSPLLQEHVRAGATLTDFAGWRMPLRFTGDLAEHHAVRQGGGLFDLSHMAQIEVTGPAAAAGLDASVVSRVAALEVGRARYTMLLAPDGGVLDDVIVYRLAADDFLVVANAANRLTVLDALTARCPGTGVAVTDRTTQRSLVALQGPVAERVLGTLTDTDVTALRYYTIAAATVAGVPALLARTGYTGEDGFEVSVPASSAVSVWRALLEAGAAEGVIPCGLAARDSLRLEAGMPLYGHEIDATTTPFEAGLGRIVHLDPDREFVGRAALERRRDEPGARRLVGLAGEGRRAARAGYPVLDADGATVGTVTSGVLSPTLGHPVAMALVHDPAGALVPPSDDAPSSTVHVDVRGQALPMSVVALPFYRRPR